MCTDQPRIDTLKSSTWSTSCCWHPRRQHHYNLSSLRYIGPAQARRKYLGSATRERKEAELKVFKVMVTYKYNIITIKVKMVTICDEHKRSLSKDWSSEGWRKSANIWLMAFFIQILRYIKNWWKMLHQKTEHWSHPHPTAAPSSLLCLSFSTSHPFLQMLLPLVDTSTTHMFIFSTLLIHCYSVFILIFCNGCFMKQISST